jgi:hypothetical protein
VKPAWLLAAAAAVAAAAALPVWGYVAGYRHGWRNGSEEQHDVTAWPDAATWKGTADR